VSSAAHTGTEGVVGIRLVEGKKGIRFGNWG
jgi:hypothetical protein